MVTLWTQIGFILYRMYKKVISVFFISIIYYIFSVTGHPVILSVDKLGMCEAKKINDKTALTQLLKTDLKFFKTNIKY